MPRNRTEAALPCGLKLAFDHDQGLLFLDGDFGFNVDNFIGSGVNSRGFLVINDDPANFRAIADFFNKAANKEEELEADATT